MTSLFEPSSGDDTPTLQFEPDIPVSPVPEPPPVRRDRRWMLVAAGAIAVLLATTGVGAVTMGVTADVAPGTRVLGVDIGGRSRADAAKALEEGLRDRVGRPVDVRVASRVAQLPPAEVGLAVDIARTVDRAAKGWANPLAVLFGGRDVDPVITVDADKLHKALSAHMSGATKLVKPAIRYEGLEPKPVYPQAGQGLDKDRSAEAVRDGWLRAAHITIPLAEVRPESTREDVDKLLHELAEPAVAAPVTVSTPRKTITVPPEAIAASLIMESDDRGRITPRVDAKRLRAALGATLRGIETQPKDATIAVDGGRLVTTPASPGTLVDVDTLAADLLGILPKPAPREVPAKVKEVQPKLSNDALVKLGVQSRISTFTTRFAPGQSRTTNIRLVAAEVDDTLVLPGATFSLNRHTGERTRAKGYVEAPAIIDGKFKNDVGGGVSQFATTLFNAMYYGGFEDVHHQPHGYYISRYPAVIEATVFYPGLDIKFRNDSPYGVVIDTVWTPSSITISMWSTKRYDIRTVWGPRRDITQPKIVHLREEDCHPSSGSIGFAQEAWRIFVRGGAEVRRQRFFWRYNAQPNFICDPMPPRNRSPH